MKLNFLKINLKLGVLALVVLFVAACDKEKDPVEGAIAYFEHPDFIKDGLISCYFFEGNANDYLGNNNGVVNGAKLSTGRLDDENSAYSFDGVDDYIELPSSPSLNISEGTICFWIRVTGDSNEKSQAIISKVGETGIGYIISAYSSTGYWFDELYGGGTVAGTSLDAQIGGYADDYTFVVYAFNNTERYFYFNGNLTLKYTVEPKFPSNNNNQPLLIGKSLISYPSCINFEGEIDDLLIYERKLSDEEVKQLKDWKK